MTDRTRPDTKRQRDLKLELTWVGKDHRPRLEPRILLEDPEKNYHAAARVTDTDQFENMLIFGDNLLALQSLATDPKVKGKVKCIYIDPPYRTGMAFEHYDDGMEHSLWLSLMRERVDIFHDLLAEDGVIFAQIDYRESARLKLLLDEVFGESCFKNEIIVKRGTKNVQSQFETIDSLSSGHDTIYLYSKSTSKRFKKLVAISEDTAPGKWDTFWRGTDRPTMRFELLGVKPERGQWRWSKDRAFQARDNYLNFLRLESNLTLDEYIVDGNEDLDFVRLNDEGVVQYYVAPRNYKLLSDVWLDISTTGRITDFAHEKHEELLQRIIGWVTEPGDLVLDSFAGSGTTGAVAHKMGRRWIMVELGEHAHTHIIPRMQKVIDGTDQGGISQAVGWKGGGGFRYFKLAPTLIKKDKRGNEIINPEYNAEMLAEACCKLKGFAFEPSTSRELWWQQGRSSERDFLFVTTRYMDYASLQDLSEEVGPERTLLVLVKAYDREGEVFDNLTLEKIPESVLHLAEWDHDDYSLKVENLPKAAPDKELVTTAQRAERRGSRNMAGVPDLFAGTGEDS